MFIRSLVGLAASVGMALVLWVVGFTLRPFFSRLCGILSLDFARDRLLFAQNDICGFPAVIPTENPEDSTRNLMNDGLLRLFWSCVCGILSLDFARDRLLFRSE